MTTLDRRNFLAGSLAGAGALLLGGEPAGAAGRARNQAAIIQQNGGRTSGVPRAGEVLFTQGVASGQSTPRGITLWTLAAGIDRDARLELEIARDPSFRNVVARRDVVARKGAASTVHARVDGGPLRPGQQYFYRFASRQSDSPVGRFRTALPPDSRQPVRIGFFSCQAYDAGYYTAHAGLAAEDDLDLVVCLGDYIYERSFYDDGPRQDRLGENRDGEVEDIGGYRAKYGLYHSDANLRRLRQSHPIMAIWDDHEVEDNYAAHRPGEATLDRDLPFLRRRRSAYQAFFEHMPRIRFGREPDRIYGKLALGRNADLFLLDERQYRDDQPCGDQLGTANCPEAFAPGRTKLGDAQRRWLKASLEGSRATWKIVGNQDMVMALDTPAGNPINPDQWDGYKAERRELMNFVRTRGIDNVSFVTGDIHTFFAGNVTPSGREPDLRGSVATEFVGGSMTSEGIADSTAREPLEPQQRALLAKLSDSGVRANNPHIKYSNQEFKGYGVLEARPDELRVDFKAVRSTKARRSSTFTLQRFRVRRDRPQVEVLGPPLGGTPN
jgi:alkaline phosphatase D